MVEKLGAEILGAEEPVQKVYSIREAAGILGVSRNYVYLLIHMKRIKARKIGAQYTISQAEIDRYRDGHDKPEINR